MTTDTRTAPVDVALIGGGIMSATLGAMLALLQPDWRVTIVERADDIATESSQPWNNAGTGHSGYCELNYMPDPADAGTPAAVAEQFALSRRWWAHLVDSGLLDPAFVTTARTWMWSSVTAISPICGAASTRCAPLRRSPRCGTRRIPRSSPSGHRWSWPGATPRSGAPRPGIRRVPTSISGRSPATWRG